MSYLPRRDALIRPDWSDLVAELDRWGEAGRTARLWWRDDDAVAAASCLDDLLRLADGVPLALAVIPALARPELAAALAARPQIAILQHGWQHVSRAATGKKSEYPETLPAALVGAELAAGRARLCALFGGRALPVFVPPWNRFAERFQPLLDAFGIVGLSATASRRAAPLPPGLVRIDAEIDMVAWRGDRGFIGETAALNMLIRLLEARRSSASPEVPPVGILTHHRVMDRATAAFLERLIGLAEAHGAVRWAAVGELLQ